MFNFEYFLVSKIEINLIKINSFKYGMICLLDIMLSSY